MKSLTYFSFKHSEITYYSNKDTFVDNAKAVTEGEFVTDGHESINQGKNQGQIWQQVV